MFAASRNSQARVYRNDPGIAPGAWPGSLFTDVTQSALIDTGATLIGASNYGVDAGPWTSVPMASQASMQFQASIPGGLSGGLSGTISDREEGSDRAGNAFVSSELTYVQSSSGLVPVLPLGSGTPGVSGTPFLVLQGSLVVGGDADLFLCDAAPSSACALFSSVDSVPQP